MSQNNTNRDIRRFETDADGNTTRILLNTDEPLGLLDGDYQEQLEELQNRLNAITGGAYSNTVQIAHGGTGAETAKAAMSNLVTALDSIFLSDAYPYAFVARRTGGPSAGNVYTLAQGAVAEQIGALKASNNLSDIGNASNALGNLIYNSNDISDTVTSFDGIDDEMLPLQTYGGYSKFTNKITIGKLVNLFKGILLQKSNNLSDLTDKNTAIKNLLDGAMSLSGQITGGAEIMTNNSGIPSALTGGKITINDLFNVLIGNINTEYGMSKNAGTGLYDFTGNAASAMKAETVYSIVSGDPSSSLGRRSFNCRRKTFSGLNPGDNTVTFDPLFTNSTVLNYNILSVSCISVDSGRSVTVKSFSVECESVPSNSDYEYTVTADIYVNGTGISFDLEVLYSYEVSV